MSAEQATYTLITGASSGIGRTIAIELSKSSRLILNGRNRLELEETLRLCYGDGHVIWMYDLANTDSLQADFEQFVVDNSFCIVNLVYAAGVACPRAIRATDAECIQRMLSVNAISAILLTCSLVKRAIAKENIKSIVYISSISAGLGTSGSAVYGASKAMLDGFVKSAAVELAPNVRVNSIRPGFVRSRMTESLLSDPHVEEAISKRHPLGIGNPENIAGAVSFLLSNEASWITGQNIAVDGGVSCDLTFK